ncbi:MAG TPA: DUF1801 domain-containing protein [Gemmatimonadaceae bacterium]
MTATRSVDSILSGYTEEVRATASAAQELIRSLLPGVEETVDPTLALLSYGYGPGYAGMICTLILSKSGVKLGLVRGGDLPDPKHLLEGSGKVHRYVQLKTPANVRKPGINALIKAAYAQWRERNNR